MKTKSRTIVILSIVFGYVLLQFLWWEILLVRQTGQIISEKEKLTALAIADQQHLSKELMVLRGKKLTQTVMIVGEGTVFLLLLLFGMYKIKQAIDKESALAQQQKNFFLSITHELKTPIAATKLQLQTMQRPGVDDETKEALITNALIETERLNKLINNILFAARVESEQFQLKTEKTDLKDYLSELAKRYFSDQILQQQLVLELQEPVTCEIDKLSFQSIIINLLENAFKYCGNNFPVVLALYQNGSHTIIDIKDKGQGIQPEDKLKIFERFYRVGDEETRRSNGTGLGLYIVKFLIEQHKGQINVIDNNPHGSVFQISLPRL